MFIGRHQRDTFASPELLGPTEDVTSVRGKSAEDQTEPVDIHETLLGSLISFLAERVTRLLYLPIEDEGD